MPLWDFRCSNGHVTEAFLRDGMQAVECRECGNEAVRMPVAAFSRPPRDEGWGSDFEWTPSMWAAHETAEGHLREAENIAREYRENGFTG